MGETADQPSDQRSLSTLNEFAIFGLIALEMLVVLVPVAVAIGHLWLIAPFALAVAAGIAFEHTDDDFGQIRQFATARPYRSEFVLAGAKQLQTTAFLGIAILWASFPIRWIVEWINFLSWSDETVAAVAVAVSMLAVIVGVTMVAAEDMAKVLYPATAGIPSGFSAFVRNRRALALAVILLLGTVVVAMCIFLSDGAIRWETALLFLFALYVITLPLAPEEHESVQDRPPEATLQAAMSAFGDDRAILFPRTRREDIDPLLLDVDLLVFPVEETGTALAVDIKQWPSDAAVDWTVGSALVTASKAIEMFMGTSSVHPVVLLVDAKPDEALSEFSRSESVTLVQLDTAAHDVRISGDSADSDLQDASKRLLASLADDGAPAANTDSAPELELSR